MSAELLLQEAPKEFAVAPISPVYYLTSRHLSEQNFIDTCLSVVPSEPVEDVGAVVHETNRIPDSRVLIVSDGKILRLDGIPVDDSIEKSSYLGKLEYEAFREIKGWANENSGGAEIWFSGPFPNIYPVSKIDLGEIRYSSDQKTKVLLKKAILLDIPSETLLGIANIFVQIIGLENFSSVEQLKSTPIFCTKTELEILLDITSRYTDQTLQIESGEDLDIKLKTYDKLKSIQSEVYIPKIFTHGNVYHYLRQRAKEEKIVGDKSESCPGSKTAFQAFSQGSEIMEASFPCPRCQGAIPSGRGITTCPHCGLTKEEAGSTCG